MSTADLPPPGLGLPCRVRTIQSAVDGSLYLSADDMKRMLHDPDVLYTFGCLMKVHVERTMGDGDTRWRGLVQMIAGAFLKIGMGDEALIIQAPEQYR